LEEFLLETLSERYVTKWTKYSSLLLACVFMNMCIWGVRACGRKEEGREGE
jgi:hypothetical protein